MTEVITCNCCEQPMNGYQSLEDPDFCVDCYLWEIKKTNEIITGETGDNETITCFGCNGKITPDYCLICQSKEDWQRNISYLICSPNCNLALQDFGYHCHQCETIYLHDRYDGWICPDCKKKSQFQN